MDVPARPPTAGEGGTDDHNEEDEEEEDDMGEGGDDDLNFGRMEVRNFALRRSLLLLLSRAGVRSKKAEA